MGIFITVSPSWLSIFERRDSLNYALIFSITILSNQIFTKDNTKNQIPKLYLHFFIDNSCQLVRMDLERLLLSDMKSIGEFIFSERKKLGIGKKKFGELCGGLSETYIRNLENGVANITLKTLVKLKSGLNLTVPVIIIRNERTFSYRTLKLARAEDFNAAKQNFSSRLSAIVRHKKLSSIQFSNYLGMDESATNKYLNGSENPTYLMLLRFAYVLDVQVVDFFDYAGALPDNTGYKPRYLEP